MAKDSIGRIFLIFHGVAEGFEGAVAVAPVLEDLDVEGEEAALAGELLDVFAGLDAQLLDGLALVADEDGFLAFALDEDEAGDIVDAVAFFVGLDGHFAAVGDFFLVVKEYFFAHYLADKEAHGAVGEFVLGEVRRALG